MRSLVWLAVLAFGACVPTHRAQPSPAPPAALAPPAESSSARAVAPTFDVSSLSCGELELKRAGLRAAGEGERHPRMSAVGKALAARCPRGAAGPSLVTACPKAREDREALLARGLGPRHPDVIVVNAEIAICPPPAPPAPPRPPTAEECTALRARRQALLAEGKGAKHPAVIAVDARLGACR